MKKASVNIINAFLYLIIFIADSEVLERKMKNNMKIQAFCKDVANSMRFWRACRICEGKVKNNLFNENFKNYLADVKFELEAIHFVANCNCTRDNKQNELLKCPSHTSLPWIQ